MESHFDLDVNAASPAVHAVLEEAGARIPEEWEIEGPAVSISLGDATDLDPALLAAMCGPDGLGGQALGPQFGQEHAADVLRPGPVLAALTEQSVANIATLNDDQLMGALQAARRIENRAVWQQSVVVAEFARRRQAQFDDAKARKVPRGCRPGEFPADELAAELLITRNQAENRIAIDLGLTGRLPATLAGLAAGTISGGRADTIVFYTASLSDADAAHADQVLADAAPGLRIDQLTRKAAALEMKLDPKIAHGCSSGQHPWTPQSPGSPPPGKPPPEAAPPTGGPDAAQSARIRELVRRLNVTLEPIARGACDHRHAEDHYTPSRKLKHLVRARTATCSAPGCNAQAVHCDIDHVVPWPSGPTDECNTHPGCRRHHRCKQAPGWQVEEAEPGIMRWTTPAGRVYTTTPTVYDT